MRITKSDLELYIVCPRRYYYAKILEDRGYERPEQRIGRAFHDFAYWFFEWLERDKLEQCTTLDDTMEYFRQSLEGIEVPYFRKLCENFLKFEAQRWLSLRDWELYFPVMREALVTFRVQDVDFALKVDRVDLLNGYCCVVEYKLHMPPLVRIRRETCLYALALNYAKATPKETRYWACYSPVDNIYIQDRVHINTVRALKRWIQRFIEAHEKKRFPKREGNYCAFCPFLERCLRDGESS